jgi:hypothetical protein
MSIPVSRPVTASPPRSRQRPAWLDFLLSLLWLLAWVLRGVVILLVAIVTGLLIPPSDPDKYRPFAPKAREKQ